MIKYEKDGFIITEYPNGTIVKAQINNNDPIIPQDEQPLPTIDERLTNMESTLDLILLKQEGLL